MQGNGKLIYKYCIVPKCKSTVRKAPNKIFFHIPRDVNVRRKWLEAMKRIHDVSSKSTLYCCEDHFNLLEDTENYIRYKIMTLQENQKTILRLKKGVVPHIFHCQKKKKPPQERRSVLKRKRQTLVQEALADNACKQSVVTSEWKLDSIKPTHMTIVTIADNENKIDPAAESSCMTVVKAEIEEVLSAYAHKLNSVQKLDELTQSSSYMIDPSTVVDNEIKIEPEADPLSISNSDIFQVDKAVQVNIKVCYRSKGVNVNFSPKKNNRSLSPVSISFNNNSTSLKSAQHSCRKINLFSDNPEDMVAMTSNASEQSTDLDNDKQFKDQMCQSTLSAIKRHPKMLLGLPKKSYYLIKLLSENVPLPTLNILITLKKIKLNEPFSILALQFGYTPNMVSRIFSKSVQNIAEKMKQFIIWPTPIEIFKNLPISFRARYANVVSIIDYLEILIEEPSNSVHQSLTWSQQKQCNTLKYLISYTPDGLVNFVSEGYSGSASNELIVNECGFLESLPPNKAVMSSQSSTDLSCLLENNNCTLVQLPSVSKSITNVKEDAEQSRIAALRMHIEHVTNRIREFHMLQPHACIDHYMIPVLDEAIVVACGLVNVQDALINK